MGHRTKWATTGLPPDHSRTAAGPPPVNPQAVTAQRVPTLMTRLKQDWPPTGPRLATYLPGKNKTGHPQGSHHTVSSHYWTTNGHPPGSYRAASSHSLNQEL